MASIPCIGVNMCAGGHTISVFFLLLQLKNLKISIDLLFTEVFQEFNVIFVAVSISNLSDRKIHIFLPSVGLESTWE